MRNAKRKIQERLLKPTAYSPRPAFTLVEMLVAVAMGAALVAAAATVFRLASEAIGTSEANTQINSQLRVLYSWLDRDFGRIRLDGPLVILFNNIDYTAVDESTITARRDRVFFCISGDIPALTSSRHCSLASVLYGHDSAADSLSGPTHEDMFELSLTRWARLVSEDSIVADDEFYDPTAEFGRPVSFADLLWYWYSSATAGDDFVDTFGERADIDGNEDFAEMISHVISFGVSRVGLATGSIMDMSETLADAGSELRFRPGLEDPIWIKPDLTSLVLVGAGNKPVWIEFEIVLQDSNGRLPEGYTATYRVNLPSR